MIPLSILDFASDPAWTLMIVGFLTGLSSTLGAAAAQQLIRKIQKVNLKKRQEEPHDQGDR